ncbi:hypothetical protein VTK56DRAFT_5107 [Thermocarpiscus australiensis]
MHIAFQLQQHHRIWWRRLFISISLVVFGWLWLAAAVGPLNLSKPELTLLYPRSLSAASRRRAQNFSPSSQKSCCGTSLFYSSTLLPLPASLFHPTYSGLHSALSCIVS